MTTKVIKSFHNFLRGLLLCCFAGFICYNVLYDYMHVTPTPLATDAKQVCYNATGEYVRPEHKAIGALIRVNWIDGYVMNDGERVAGMARYMYDDELNQSVCEVWIPMPKRVLGDDRMDTVGHEVLHCLAGAFHK